MFAAASVLAGLLAPVTQAANPILPKVFTADPAAFVENGTVYLYVGHDQATPADKDYVMKEWRLYSSCDMKNWTDRGSPIQPSAFKWAIGKVDAWAADITKRDGKYYFYATVDHASIPGRAIGVAVSDKPEGPFVDARGSALITNNMTLETQIAWDDIDPAIFQDDDGQAYLYWGNSVLKWAKLKANMIELDGPIHTVGVERFTEASYLHKHNGTYYLSYSREFPEETAYMTGPSATGPWTYRGVIMSKNVKVKTIHQAIVEFNGKNYIIYHNAKLPGGGEYRRSVAVEEFAYNADGTIPFIKQTKEGPAANPSAACK
ncbi:family 43 glycosylhydrolase [Duganella dendranthematis]|jgi:beta-xylosidase|uniref:Family 43 glycosylhydrolase n=1 Tax=Duganella dendranthematis TaxID=2728021 RepID=A0ABX6MK93_9BURK|nr:glycoside hydrolase family 43 protein [Duganella dendranthematis]QJD94339.1 family 43 glycosylhydrolase [Duganella dendranthematis]